MEVTKLVNTTELWFVCVNNPDGYEYTFTEGNRLWRKNLADNNDDGQITIGDGVDPNRNFSSNWGRDDDGSSPDPESETYRGPSPASEPETQAMEALFAEIHPVFQKNDHTAASSCCSTRRASSRTPRARTTRSSRRSPATRSSPAIPGLHPRAVGRASTSPTATSPTGPTTPRTSSRSRPEGTPAEDRNVTGFEYPDSPLQVQQEFERHLPFALDLAHSAHDPANPHSHLDNEADDFTVDRVQGVLRKPAAGGRRRQARARQGQDEVPINDEKAKKVDTAKDYEGGERYYKEPGVFYHRVRGVVKGTKPGDEVKVWFKAGGEKSKSFTYEASRGDEQPRPDPLQRGLLRRPAEPGAGGRAEVPRLLHGRA